MVATIHRLTKDNECLKLGEAPHWDSSTKTLYFVDIMGQAICRYDPSTNKITTVNLTDIIPHFIIPIEGKPNHFVISSKNELNLIFWDGSSDKISVIKKLHQLEDRNMHFNDAKCDSSGKLWAGTFVINIEDFTKTEPLGFLYSINGDLKIEKQLSKIRVSNGLAFNEKLNKIYFIDSLKLDVDEYDLDESQERIISTGKSVFSLTKFNIPGMPDGMTMDTDGNLWVAIFGGGRIIKIDPRKPDTLLETISLPAKNITSVTFGGVGMNELFVTSANFSSPSESLPPPENGAIFKITGTGWRGMPNINFRCNVA